MALDQNYNAATKIVDGACNASFGRPNLAESPAGVATIPMRRHSEAMAPVVPVAEVDKAKCGAFSCVTCDHHLSWFLNRFPLVFLACSLLMWLSQKQPSRGRWRWMTISARPYMP